MRIQPPLTATLAAEGLHLCRPCPKGLGGPISAPIQMHWWGATLCVTPRQTCPRPERFRAQLAFKDSMVHGILQFTPSIAFRYVLHRCKSRDIRCRESFEYSDLRRRHVDPLFPVSFPWRQLRRIFCVVLGRRSGATVRLSGILFPGVSCCFHLFAGRSAEQASTMILPQVHLRKPCYDFSFL